MKSFNWLGLCMVLTSLGASYNANAQIYGRLKANWMQADNALNSFVYPNMSAPITATNLDVYTGEDGPRSTFQVVQSRIGGKFKINEKVTTIIETDFIDFAQSSPTTSAHPRLRRALISHQLSENFNLQIGQDWDIFSAMAPQTFNYVGLYFNAGNVGFMRNQIIGRLTNGTNKYSFAIGQAGKSSSPGYSELEEEQRTSLAASYEKTWDNSVLQLGAIYADRDFNSETQKVWGASLGLSYKNSFIALTSEFYLGEGLSKLALLSLPSSSFAHEAGGYVTAEFKLENEKSVYTGVGHAYAQNPGDTVYDSATSKFTNLGANKNTNIKLGISKSLDGVKYYSELTRYHTEYKKEFQVTSIELGTLLHF